MWGIAPSRPVVQCFAKQNDHWFLVGDLGADFQLSTLSAYPLTSPIQGRTWVLLAGKAIGSANGILRLEVATCDGKTFTRKWVKTNIIEGEVEVYGDSVVLTYEKLDEQGRVVWYPTNHVRFTETLRVTPNGLE